MRKRESSYPSLYHTPRKKSSEIDASNELFEKCRTEREEGGKSKASGQIKREVFEQVGIFDENFSPAFWEDNDLSFRAMYKGFSLAYCNSTFIYHNHSTTSSSVDRTIPQRNKEYFFKKHPLGKWAWENKRTSLIKSIIRYIKGCNQ